MLGRFLEGFGAIFEDDDPKARWDEFYALHRCKYPSFRRDMKRALWRIEDALVGPTKLELLAPMLADDQDASSAGARPKYVIEICVLLLYFFYCGVGSNIFLNFTRKRICRAALETKFSGTPQDWKDLSVVNSVRLDQVGATETKSSATQADSPRSRMPC